jgi:hypothetical protein
MYANVYKSHNTTSITETEHISQIHKYAPSVIASPSISKKPYSTSSPTSSEILVRPR